MLWDETDVNFPLLPKVPPLRRDSEDSRAADFVGEDLTTNADYQPENLRSTHTQPDQPNVRVQEDVQTNPDPTATPGAACLGPAGHTAATPEQTIEDKIRTFHIPDDPPSSQSQTAPPTQIPDRKSAKKIYDSQKSSVTKLINIVSSVFPDSPVFKDNKNRSYRRPLCCNLPNSTLHWNCRGVS